ncbi:hypothetical protein [Clostridium sp.]|nr:hypothetical protein [Clostridium sp.]
MGCSESHLLVAFLAPTLLEYYPIADKGIIYPSAKFIAEPTVST